MDLETLKSKIDGVKEQKQEKMKILNDFQKQIQQLQKDGDREATDLIRLEGEEKVLVELYKESGGNLEDLKKEEGK